MLGTVMILKERLVEQRLALGLSKKKLAEMLNLEQSTYGKYELGKRQPSLEMLQKLSEIFAVSVDYLLGISDEPTLQSNKELSKSDNSLSDCGDTKIVITKAEQDHLLKTSLEMLQKLSKTFSVPVDNLLSMTDEDTLKSEKEKLNESDTYLLGIDGTRIVITKEEQKKILNIIEAAMPEIFDNDI
jgi:transcriptional regulator with XRE-family HTH domain